MDMKRMLAVAACAAILAAAAPALAANPFSDVPLNHWAYDAVENLAAKGILEGYPDGAFRGKKAMTRYEIAQMVAKMMNCENMSNEDIEQLKALVAEFGPELEALGVKVDSFDSRMTALEKGMSGWKISGEMRYDFKAFDYQGAAKDLSSGNRRNGFDLDRGRLFLHRDLPNGLSFDSRWQRDDLDNYYLTARDFMGIGGLRLRLGAFVIDWDLTDNMRCRRYTSSDSWMTDLTYRGAEFTYKMSNLDIVGLIASDNSGHSNGNGGVYHTNESNDVYAARFKAYFGERLWLSATMLAESFDTQDDGTTDATYTTYWANLGYTIFPGFQLKGSYYFQDWEEDTATTLNDGTVEDSPSAYRVIFDIDQSVLKFTSLWAQYSHFDAGFKTDAVDYKFDNHGGKITDMYEANSSRVFLTDHDMFYAFLNQQWTPKIRTFEEFQYADADGASDATRWSFGVGYQYTPALYFEVAYSMQDGHCNVEKDESGYKDRIFRFRTVFSF